MSLWHEITDCCKALAMMMFWVFAAWVAFILWSGCGADNAGLMNFIPTRSFEARTQQELKDFIANQVSTSSENVQNELWPWMVAIMFVYGGGKISGMVMYAIQHRGLKRAINGGIDRPP